MTKQALFYIYLNLFESLPQQTPQSSIKAVH